MTDPCWIRSAFLLPLQLLSRTRLTKKLQLHGDSCDYHAPESLAALHVVIAGVAAIQSNVLRTLLSRPTEECFVPDADMVIS